MSRSLIQQVLTGKTTVFLFSIMILFGTQGAEARIIIDAPHNWSNGIECEACHGAEVLATVLEQYEEAIAQDPYNLDITLNNFICKTCHREHETLDSEYTTAPDTSIHSSSQTGSNYWPNGWSKQCVNCHNPHRQEQKWWLTDSNDPVDPQNFFLAQGSISNLVYDREIDQSVLTIDWIAYKPFSQWNADTLVSKNGLGRKTTIYPDVSNLRFSYTILEINEAASTITVNGDARLFWYVKDPSATSTEFGVIYGQLIKMNIKIYADPADPETYLGERQVKFFDNEGVDSFVNVDGERSGICQVCHTKTKHYTYDGIGDDGVADMIHTHSADSPGMAEIYRCPDCHFHAKGFAVPGLISAPGKKR